mmetsp:Transcript_24783/g.48584  ORF Transcript_24783/g.48584 Transcript_24783/m.48584 type:complete len:81 (-) Transcript_24783:84-326(-)
MPSYREEEVNFEIRFHESVRASKDASLEAVVCAKSPFLLNSIQCVGTPGGDCGRKRKKRTESLTQIFMRKWVLNFFCFVT